MKILFLVILGIIAYMILGYAIWFIIALFETRRYGATELADEELIIMFITVWPIVLPIGLIFYIANNSSDLVDMVSDALDEHRRNKDE